jgi:pimeloyl-ACP methyl ester carboxylesterase
MTPAIIPLHHNAITLALHHLAGEADAGRPLLLLHGLGERSPETVPDWAGSWSGPVYALDFVGHGQSEVPKGGGYSAEVLMADVDVALAELGPSTVVGRGLGAYIALLIAGARPQLVRGAVLGDGPGLFGGGVGPTSATVLTVDHEDGHTPDPWALAELARDVRPPDYATSFVHAAMQLSGLAWPIAVCARWRAPWLEAVAAEPGVLDMSLEDAIRYFGNQG